MAVEAGFEPRRMPKQNYLPLPSAGMVLPDYGYFIIRSDIAKASEPAMMFSDWLQDAVSARNHSRNDSAP